MSIFDEFNERFSGRFFGKYRGYVTRVDDDPKNMGRIMVKVPVVLGTDDDLGWALPAPAFGGSRNVGFVALPAKGDFVWVEFEEGDPERPIWSAGPWPLASGESFMPKHSQGKGDATDYAMRDFGNIPPSQFAGSYGKVFTLQAHDGSFFELDGSDAHRVQMSHYTGTRIEMTQDGSLQEAVAGMARKRTTSDLNVEVGGSHLFYICGDEKKTVNGFTQETYAKGVSRLYGFRLNQTPGLDEASMDPADSAKLYDSDGNAIYIPADLKEKGSSYLGIWDNSIIYRTGGQYSISAGGNMDLIGGSKISMTATSQVAITASESVELVGMNTMYGDIGASAANPAKAATVYGYNGISEFISYDITGMASCSGLVADPGMAAGARAVPSTLLFSQVGPKTAIDMGSPVVGGSIKLLGVSAPSPNTFLGGNETTALQSVPQWELLMAILTTMQAALIAHTHEHPIAPTITSSSYALATSSVLTSLQAVGSKTVKVAP